MISDKAESLRQDIHIIDPHGESFVCFKNMQCAKRTERQARKTSTQANTVAALKRTSMYEATCKQFLAKKKSTRVSVNWTSSRR